AAARSTSYPGTSKTASAARGNHWQSSSQHGKQTTRLSPSVLDVVTITHPFHPLCGQKVEVIHVIQQQSELQLYIQYPTGEEMYIQASLTDYAGEVNELDLAAMSTKPQLSGQGLRALAEFIRQRKS
nr:hypothetical protein [Anaerolineae bacterium]